MINSTNDTNGQGFNVLRVQLGLDKEEVTKSASVEDKEELNKLASAHFCDPISRSFPTHTKEASMDSIVYFYGNKLSEDGPATDRESEGRLFKAAKFWGIESNYYKVKRAFIDAKEASCDSCDCSDSSCDCSKKKKYALDGKLPINDEEEVKKSAQALVDQRGNLSYKRRNGAAVNILKEATQLDLSMEEDYFDEIQKMAGLLLKDRQDISDNISTRGLSFERAGISGGIYKEASKQVASCSCEDIDDLCDVLDAYEHTKQAKRVSVGALEDVFFKAASKGVFVDLTNGERINMDVVKEASLTPFYALGVTVPLKVTNERGELNEKKASEFLKTISKEDSDLFVSALEKCKK